jgi:DNA-binding transcriptional regulator YiaG
MIADSPIVDSTMTARQFKKLRKSIGYSQSQLAREMDLYVRSISRWETGEVPLPKLAELALLYLAEQRKKRPMTLKRRG